MMAEVNPNMQLHELLDFDPVPDLVGKPMDFADFLNLDGLDGMDSFDESASAADSSPQTMSPNHTPSPGAMAPTPPHYEDDAFAFILPEEKKLPLGGPVTMGEVQVKQEIVEPAPAPIAAPTAPVAPDAAATSVTLPAAQQEALQQLLANFMTYQQQFGLVNVAESATNSVGTSTPGSSINPSLVFSTASPAPSATTSSLTPSSAAPSIVTPPVVTPAVQLVPPVVESVDEPLVAISPGETPDLSGPSRMSRATSIMSNDALAIDDKIDKLVPLSSIFSTGRGKGGKKGGGMSSVVRGEDEELDDDESWRPSPEEYKKLSSKEKRQLRNKLSARAFRTRRKDYIGTLEAHIKDRDSVIDAIRAELLNSRAENQDLRRELDALKSGAMSVLHPESAEKLGQSPAMLKALAQADLAVPAPGQQASPARRPQADRPVVNTRKDVSAFDARGFWGGSNDNMLGGGNTICHTVFSPELTLPPQPNLNPLLNNLSTSAEKPVSLNAAGNRDIDGSSFADWAVDTPYNMRSMDSYRMQLWSRLAREAAADKAGVPAELRPKFLVDPKSSPSVAPAAAAASAVEHITTKLYSSFWSAFSGSSSKIDTEKLAAVVTGRARLAVIDEKAPAKRSASTQTTTADDLAHAMAGLKVATGTSSPLESLRVRENPLGAMAGFFKQSSPLPTRA